MRISRQSFVYRVSYGWSKNPPNQIGLCDLFWRFLFSLPLLTALYSIGFLFARKPRAKKESELLVPYKKWPQIGGCRILPIFVIMFIPYVYKLAIMPRQTIIVSIFVFSCAAASIGLVWLLGSIFELFQNSSISRLSKEFFKSKSEKICPVVEFVDTPN